MIKLRFAKINPRKKSIVSQFVKSNPHEIIDLNSDCCKKRNIYDVRRYCFFYFSNSIFKTKYISFYRRYVEKQKQNKKKIRFSWRGQPFKKKNDNQRGTILI